MATIEQLQRENKRLKAMQENIQEMKKIQEQRMALARENKILSKRLKHGGGSGIGKKIGLSFGKGLAKAGKSTFRGLQKYANFLEEQERKQKLLNKKLKTIKRRKKK